jgi:hypothetical protein
MLLTRPPYREAKESQEVTKTIRNGAWVISWSTVERGECVGPMRPKARGPVQHGGLPGWLEESDPAGCDFVREGRSTPPAQTDHTACLVWGWSCAKCTQTLPWATARKEGVSCTLVDPCPLSCFLMTVNLVMCSGRLHCTLLVWQRN